MRERDKRWMVSTFSNSNYPQFEEKKNKWNSYDGRFFFSLRDIETNGTKDKQIDWQNVWTKNAHVWCKFRQTESIMWRDSFKIYNDRLDRRRHNINTAKWAMQEFPHPQLLQELPKYLSNYLGVRWAIFWCSLAYKWFLLAHAMHPHQFQMQRTMLRWLCFDSMNVAPWKMFLVLIYPNLRRRRQHYCYWICCFSSRVDHRHRSIGTILTRRKTKLHENSVNRNCELWAYIRLEYIEDGGFGVADIVVLLNGLFDMRLHKLIQFIAILICVDTRCNFGDQNDQQKAEELKNVTKT